MYENHVAFATFGAFEHPDDLGLHIMGAGRNDIYFYINDLNTISGGMFREVPTYRET